jgi:hypothetical protein
MVEQAGEAKTVGPAGGWDGESPRTPEDAARRWRPYKLQQLLQ